MSYESEMLKSFNMPNRIEVEKELLKTLFKHDGVIKEFSVGQEIVDEIANLFNLTQKQRAAYLETIYRKENRRKKSYLWHRLLFRAADSLAKRNLVSRPTDTHRLTNEREWMLTEKGIDAALKILNVPHVDKYYLPVKTFEVQKIIKNLNTRRKPTNYNPIDNNKKKKKRTINYKIRSKAFRRAVVEAYDYKCSFCGMKINSPDKTFWEVEAAHIVPHKFNGKDDIWNGLALCHLHHWAFDVGWFTLLDDYSIKLSSRIDMLPTEYGKFGDMDFIKSFVTTRSRFLLPKMKGYYPHKSTLQWHRTNIFNYFNRNLNE